MILAILLAKAMAATLAGLRDNNAFQPRRCRGAAAGMPQHRRGAQDEKRTQRRVAHLGNFSRRSLPPLECIFGVNPIHAAKCRPDVKGAGVRYQCLDRCGSDRPDTRYRCKPPHSIVPPDLGDDRRPRVSTRSVSTSTWSASILSAVRAARGKRSIILVAYDCEQRPDLGQSLGSTMPSSARWPRTALTAWVRWRTKRSRVFSTIRAAWHSAVLIGTKRMVGRDTASHMASASTASVLPRFT